jgi:predicted ATPase/DNA-binding CsgD family transcriptional regulator
MHSLLAQLTPLLGRKPEVASACALLRRAEVRLLVVTGPGGIGKTRLALQIVSDLHEDFSAGVCFVALDALHDPTLVAPTIFHTLGLRESASESVVDQLKGHLREKQLLMLVDNFEQVAHAAPLLTELLAACPQLKLLVTSRARLHVRGEHEMVVPPLALPDLQHLADSEAVSQYASVALFLQQVRALQPQFKVSRSNARTIAEICIHLEGMPLAIELAAARITQLSPQALLSRLSQRLDILTRGTQDAPVRQQTLRNTLAWSYDLLSPWEQWLFRRLSIFVHGCTLEAAEAICAASGMKARDGATGAFDGVASLIDKSLLYLMEHETDEPHFGMLETTREYGRELIDRCEETEALRQAHAHYYLNLAERAAQAWEGPQHAVWLRRLERDNVNLREAMQWALEGGEDPDRVEVAIRFGGALRSFWLVRGYFLEGRSFLERVMAQSEGSHTSQRAKFLNDTVHLVTLQGDYEWGEVLCQQNLARCRELGDGGAIARALYLLAWSAMLRGNLARAHSLAEESIALSREMGDQGGILMASAMVATVAIHQGEYARAQALSEQILAAQRRLANKRGMAWTLLGLAWLLIYSQREPERAEASLAEAITLCQEIGDKWGIAEYCWLQGQFALEHAEVATAIPLLEQSVTLFRELGILKGTAHALCLLGRVSAMQQDWASARAFSEEGLKEALAANVAVEIALCLEGVAGVIAAEKGTLASVLWAAQLWGTAEALRERMGAPLPPVDRASYERSVASARNSLGKRLFSAYWAQGRSLTPEQALAAQGNAAIPSEPAPLLASSAASDSAANSARLTVREVEVLRWVARGLTDAQVAAQLVISTRTVTSHLSSIYNKLGVSSRSAATRIAVDHQLV